MKKLLGLGLVLLAVTGCGDLFMKDKGDGTLNLSGFNCKLDTKAFSRILDQNIKSDIICLQEKIHAFIELVKSDRPGAISEKTLLKFIEKGPIDLGGADTIPIVQGIFDLTQIILGGERGYISKPDFDRFVSFLIQFNKNIYPVSAHFTDESDLTYEDYERVRKQVRRHLTYIVEDLQVLTADNRNTLDRIDVSLFLKRFFADDPKTAEKIKSVMFLKKAFLGGDPMELTHLELEDAYKKLPFLSEVAYDFIKLGNFAFKERPETMINDIYLKDLGLVRAELKYGANENEPLFDIEDIYHAINTMELDLGIELEKYTREIIKVKEILVGNNGFNFTSSDLHELLRHGNEVLMEASFFDEVFKMYQEELLSKYPLTTDFMGFPWQTPQEKTWLEHFSHIANEYRFFKGDALSPYYSLEHSRSYLGIVEIAAYEYGVKLLMSHYQGTQSAQYNHAARGGIHLTYDETVNIIEDIKRFLRDQGIIKIGKALGGEVEAAADNVVLMSTLFQYQSDGCNNDEVCLEVPEITEFLVGLFTAVSFKDFFTEKMQDRCGPPAHDYNGNGFIDDEDRSLRAGERSISPECFRENFMSVLREPNLEDRGLSISDYMPQLNKYLDTLTQDVGSNDPPTISPEYSKFLYETESFTRTCMYYDEGESDPVFLSGDDAFAVFAGMINIESTLMKFDLDQNNQLDYHNANGVDEVLNAYNSTYKGAIEGMVAKNGELVALAGRFLPLPRAIFQYLVKKGKVPGTWDTIKWMLSSYNSKLADADRSTVATILKVLGEQNRGDNYFKCQECLDHECVPLNCTGGTCVEDPWD